MVDELRRPPLVGEHAQPLKLSQHDFTAEAGAGAIAATTGAGTGEIGEAAKVGARASAARTTGAGAGESARTVAVGAGTRTEENATEAEAGAATNGARTHAKP